ncbi:tRNA lysidine(34) synthetase TilS [Paenibacillus aceris]|uniref:tRNA(Ile)-lysidine synthase n=1 Tax=Paenibacillus aceris TaxID=869555 RepID=A0ABS4I979_9BACL|nr:tRNA lysidine(34) synthetase TilS [Paenibacillus aceris]MBP1967235.1 tRNA(Ile)-lysidine synthase [Paenibacillus aceris]NHW36273.1 tRNA lysidine(34) synthetase TilS [Paenibacillus aceris]
MEIDLVAVVRQRITEEKLADPGDVVVVAVSGGPDSVALLHVLFTLAESFSWKLVVAHVNHQFRGAESDAEASFVMELAKSLGLPCEIGVIDVPAYIEETSLNGQAAAREKRYDFLHQVAADYRAQRIAFAHHADDQAETVLMRILRGTGPSGLVGMPERRREKKMELIRPFLRIYKSDIVNYCFQHEIRYCKDSSNELRKYFRNQIRLDVMPMLKQYNEQLPESLNRLTDMMRAEDDYMAEETEQVLRRIATFRGAVCRLQRSDFTGLHVALQRRLIKLILNCLCLGMDRLEFNRIESVRELILQDQVSNQVLQVHDALYIVREYEDIQFQTFAPTPKPYTYEIGLDTDGLNLPEIEAKLYISRMPVSSIETADLLSSATDVFLDLDQLQMPLAIRSRRSGDRLEPHGLNGSKKVKDMFIDAKMPLSRRDVIPLLVDASGQILWVAGFRRSKHALVGPDTERVLHLKLVLR